MLLRRMFKVANAEGSEFAEFGTRYANEKDCAARAKELNRELCAASEYLRAVPCFVLEFPQERGNSVFFDLGNPIQVFDTQHGG